MITGDALPLPDTCSLVRRAAPSGDGARRQQLVCACTRPTRTTEHHRAPERESTGACTPHAARRTPHAAHAHAPSGTASTIMRCAGGTRRTLPCGVARRCSPTPTAGLCTPLPTPRASPLSRATEGRGGPRWSRPSSLRIRRSQAHATRHILHATCHTRHSTFHMNHATCPFHIPHST